MRWTATGLMIFVTVNGPMNLGASLLQTVQRGMFLDESHFLTNDVDGRLTPVAIGLGLGARPHPDERLSGSAPGAMTPLDKRVSGGNRDFGFCTGKNRCLVP